MFWEAAGQTVISVVVLLVVLPLTVLLLVSLFLAWYVGRGSWFN